MGSVVAVAMTWPQYLRAECSVTGFTLKLTDYEAQALLLLMLRCPNSVSKDELIEWLWPDPGLEPEFTETMIYQTMRRLRAKVGEFHIPSRVNFGYRLMQQPEPQRGRERGKRGPSLEFKQAA
jgi:DNA-binding response OmpR family regulator